MLVLGLDTLALAISKDLQTSLSVPDVLISMLVNQEQVVWLLPFKTIAQIAVSMCEKVMGQPQIE